MRVSVRNMITHQFNTILHRPDFFSSGLNQIYIKGKLIYMHLRNLYLICKSSICCIKDWHKLLLCCSAIYNSCFINYNTSPKEEPLEVIYPISTVGDFTLLVCSCSMDLLVNEAM